MEKKEIEYRKPFTISFHIINVLFVFGLILGSYLVNHFDIQPLNLRLSVFILVLAIYMLLGIGFAYIFSRFTLP